MLDAKNREGELVRAMEAYADGGYRPGDIPTMSFINNGNNEGKSAATINREREVAEQAVDAVTQMLADACFVQWVKTDPMLPHAHVPAAEQAMNRRLAKIVAAFCHAALANSWDRQTGAFFKDRPGYLTNIEIIGGTCTRRSPLAMVYDFIAPWMTDAELRSTREFLVATGPGRVTTSRGNAWVREGVLADRGISRGFAQNGNFASFAEDQVMKALVVAGEESAADPKVVETFLKPEKPKNFADRTKIFAYDWIQPTSADTGRDCPASRPYGDSMTWPHARKVDADNLLRSIFWNQDGNVSPWGFILEREAYYVTAMGQWQTALVFARFGANNQFVTGSFYNIINQLLYNQYPFGNPRKSPSFTSTVQAFNHHAGAFGQSNLHLILLKYMYPDDPAVDYQYAVRAPWLEDRTSPLYMCVFGLDPGIHDLQGTMPAVAKEKRLPLTKVDPEEGMVVLRSSWEDDALMIDLDAGFKACGHMNAEKNSFALFALGRSWALPVGFHKVYSCWQSGILVQNPAWAACPITQGYVGENPNFPPDVPDSGYPRNFPTPPGKLLEVSESPDRSWSLAAADATFAYNYMCSTEGERVGFPRANFMYPGLLPDFISRCAMVKDIYVDNRSSFYRNESKDYIPSPGTAVAQAVRTLVMVRGKRPYVLVVDDFRKGDAPANYRWMMNNTSRKEDGKSGTEGDFQMIMDPGATATEAVLLHRSDQGNDQPRLLVRDVSENDNSSQPPMRMDLTKFKAPKGLEGDFYLNEASNRLFIERNKVVDPRFKVLLFPFRTGEPLPKTAWNKEKSELTIDLCNGAVGVIAFNSNAPDHRTRIMVRHVR